MARPDEGRGLARPGDGMDSPEGRQEKIMSVLVGLGLFLRWCLRIAREDRERAQALRAGRAVIARDEAWGIFGNPGVPSVRGRVHDGEAPQAIPE